MRPIIAIDTETELIKRENQAPVIVCLSWASARDTGIITGKDEIENYLSILLRQVPDMQIVGHHIAYDWACVLANFPNLWELVFRAYDLDGILCTQTREKLLDIEIGEFRGHIENDSDKRKKHGYSLGEICERRLGRHLDKGEDGWRLRYGELLNVPLDQWPQRAIDYAKDDARNTFDLYMDQQKRASRRNYNLPTQHLDTKADFALKLMSAWGIAVDVPRAKKLLEEKEAEKENLALRLSEVGLVNYKPMRIEKDLFGNAEIIPGVMKRQLKNIRELVKKTHPNPPCTPSGLIQTTAEVLEDCKHPDLTALGEYTGLEKTISTYLSKLIVSPIHARFNTIGAVSNRTSCSDPNLQNQPRMPGVRECFIPRPGYVFLACDQSTQELRTLAQSCLDLFGHSLLAEKFQKDLSFDPHMEFALALANGDVIQAKDLRYRAKTANFGYAGGMGAEKFVKYAKNSGVNLTEQEAEFLRDAWLKQWPEMSKYFKRVSKMLGKHEFITVEHPRSGFRRARCRYTDTCNSYFQILAAHASKEGLYEVVKRCYIGRDSYLYGSRPIAFIHDENITETPEEAGHEAAQEMGKVMENAQAKWTPDIPPKTEAVLMRVWSKKAKPVFENGKLVPWEEK